MAALASGQTLLDRFTLVRPLGSGGAGRVWLAQDGELDERVVLKLVPPGADEQRVELLRRECKNARRLIHPAVVPVYDLHRGEGHAFISMAWVDGADAGVLRGQPPAAILRSLLPVVDALEHAHGHGVVHRDVKAGNVLLDRDGRARLADFGIAGLLRDDGGRVAGGSSRYNVGPQQLDGAPPRPADDIYGLGVLLYELLGGRPPFWPAIGDERIREEVPPPVRSEHALPDPLRHLVASMLAKDPSARPAGMREVRDTMRSILEELGGDDAVTTPQDAVGSHLTAVRPPPRLTPPPRIDPVVPPLGGKTGARTREDRRDSRARWGTAATVIALTLLAAWVVWRLPRWAENHQARVEEIASTPVEASAEPTPVAAEEVETDRAFPIGRAVEAIMQARERAEHLESRGVERWGGQVWSGGMGSLRDAERLRDEGAYAAAFESAEQAALTFDELGTQGLDVLQQALRDGQQALAAGDAFAAREAFELAAAVAPESEQARSGLERARVLDEVVALVEHGEQNERRGNLEAAAADYRKAAELDPLSGLAQQALTRVSVRAEDDAFSRLMSGGLTALNRGDWQAAQETFERALQQRPDVQGARDGLLQAQEGLRLEAIAHHQERAASAEADERWREAHEHYAAVLGLAPAIRFAQDGEARTARRAELAERIDHHLTHPERLSADNVLEEARLLLADAREIEPAGPEHRKRVQRLAQLVDSAATPVAVALESDGATEVTIYQVGRFGTFTRHELTLRPGRYTVVGTRSGYRDVRLEIVVASGATPPPIVVRCEDAI